MKCGFLYAGQGAQKVGMGMDLYEKYESYRELVDSLSFDFDPIKLMKEGPEEELLRTEYTQCCMSVFGAGVTGLLKEHGINPSLAMGLSLGEYGALHAAGVFGAKEYIELATFRGREMAKAGEGIPCAMSAVMGLNSQVVEETCRECTSGYVVLTNYNCPGQYVICGEEAGVKECEERLKEKGAKRTVRLKVSGPFHTKYMAKAGEALERYFEEMVFEVPKIPVILNYTGDFYDGSESLQSLLVKQVQNGIRIEDSLKKALSADIDLFVEIGPGTTLAGFLKKCAKELGKEVQVISITGAEDLEKLFELKEAADRSGNDE